MQFFDLNRQFKLNDILIPQYSLEDLSQHEWVLAKVRVEHHCLKDTENLNGQAVLSSNFNVQIELDWIIQDTGHELCVLFQGIETTSTDQHFIVVKGAQIIEQNQTLISTQALSVWIDSCLLSMLPQLRRDIKARLNLWDYVEYDV